MRKTIVFLALISCFFVGCSTKDSAIKKPFELSILHLNDGHSHLGEDSLSLRVDGVYIEAEVGGFARVVQKVQDEMAKNPNALLLNAGDTVQKSIYFTLFKGEADLKMLNLLK